MHNLDITKKKFGPDPLNPNPILDTAFLKAVVTSPNIEVGDYSYYNDPKGPEKFQDHCVQYHFDFIGDKLKIGKFCAFATDIQFIMNGANHAMTGFSTFPFNVFAEGWKGGFDPSTITAGYRGDTVIGHDVWIGREALIMPGVTIGHGSIIGTRAVVAKDVPPYSIVVGNPGKVVRKRFDDTTIEALLDIAWWDWPVDHLTQALNAVRGNDIEVLKSMKPDSGTAD